MSRIYEQVGFIGDETIDESKAHLALRDGAILVRHEPSAGYFLAIPEGKNHRDYDTVFFNSRGRVRHEGGSWDGGLAYALSDDFVLVRDKTTAQSIIAQVNPAAV